MVFYHSRGVQPIQTLSVFEFNFQVLFCVWRFFFVSGSAIATTTAAVCGLVILELFKLVQAKDTDALMNRNLSLATNTYTSFSQNEPEKFATYTERVAPDTKSLPKEAFDASGTSRT